MLASCFILVGMSYYLLNLFSGMVLAPRTPVEEREERGELFLSLEERPTCMEVSLDGRYLAIVTVGDERIGRLLVVDLEEGGRTAWSNEVRGERARWAGGSPTLFFENDGDIFALDLAQDPPALNGVVTGPGYEEDPLPSPDGRYLLWRTSAGEAGGAELRCMRLGDGEERILGAGEEPVAWDPAGDRLVFLAPPADSAGEGGAVLQEVDLQGGARFRGHTCREEARYLWWPEADRLFYVAPYRRGGEARAVWFRVHPSGEEEREASTDGLDADFSPDIFCAMRRRPLLAYPGLKGLEVLDIRGRRIIRYPHAGTSGAPLAWRESAGEVIWWGPGGLYRLRVE